MLWCPLYKWLISNALDNDAPLSTGVQRHVRRCAACRGFHELSLRLGESLTAQAREDVCPAESVSVERIVSAVGVAPTRRGFGRMYLAAAAAIVIAALAAIHYHGTRPQPPRTDYAAALRAIEDVRSASRVIAGPIAEQPAPAVITYAAQRPLAAELAALTDQTRSALRFLADCAPLRVPERRAAPSSGREDAPETHPGDSS